VTRVVVLDDYQNAALHAADWSGVSDRCVLDVINHHIEDVDELVEALAGAQIVVAMRERTPFDAALLERLADLKLLITTGMVNRSIDMEAAGRLGIVVSGTPGGGTAAAELAFGLMLALARSIPEETIRFRQRDPVWQMSVGTDLRGRTLGIVGFGRLGQQMAKYAKAFGMEVVAWSRSLSEEKAAEQGVQRRPELNTLLSEADFVSLHLPLTPETVGLIGRRQFAVMKETAYLVNTARGPLVDEAALVEALKTGRIQGAALDVFDREPVDLDNPLRDLDNLIATPHVGYVTEDTYRTYFNGAIEAIRAWLDGTPVRVLNG
jgi:phosphoglycerate dehydrogenase-like enzyme